MKDYNFDIKVSDLLNNVGNSDTVAFESKFTEELPDLSEDWISGEITLQSISKDTVMATLNDVKCTLWDICDSCSTEYNRNVLVKEYEAKFIDPVLYKDDPEDQSTGDIFPINHKNELINIEEMVIQSVVLDEPFTKRCKDCEGSDWWWTDVYDNIDDFESGGTINFS